MGAALASAKCAVAGCARTSQTQGQCEKHYHAAYRKRSGHLIACERCGTQALKPSRSSRFCSRSCASRSQDRSRVRPRSTPLADAVRSGDHERVIAEIRARANESDECWLWSGPLNQSGYANASVCGKNIAVHRLALEAKLGRKLGKVQAHHVCANAACVNPDHLEPATQSENIAEMLARRSMLARIEELERALADLDPAHPLL